jgi:hypothetical protein
MYPDPLVSGQRQRSRVAAVHERARTDQLAVTAMQESNVCRGYKGAVAAPVFESKQICGRAAVAVGKWPDLSYDLRHSA